MRRQPSDFKIRTREHVIADLSVNYLERLILLQGHVANIPAHDYGYDLEMATFDNGVYESGAVLFQLKASERPNYLNDGKHLSFTLKRADLILWNGETIPVFLIVWDAQSEIGYWLYMQDYLTRSSLLPLPRDQATATVRIPLKNIVTQETVEMMRQRKNTIVRQDKNRVNHHG